MTAGIVGFAARSALSRKKRLISTSLSVLFGVAFLTGTLVFTDTIRRTFDDLFATVYESTDSVVRSTSKVETFNGDQRDRLPGSVVAQVAEVPGVDVAAGLLSGYAQIVGSNGHVIGDPGQGPPTFGMSDIPSALSPWGFTPGSHVPGPGEVVIDAHSAKVGHLAIGDTVRVVTQTGTHEFELVGTVRFGSADSPGGASVALWDLATAQDVLLGGRDEIDIVMVHAQPGVTEAELTADIAAGLPDGVEAITGETMIDETQDAVASAMGFFATFLLVFAVIGVVVASFTIYNTFQIVVSQRLREMSLLRSIGATRRQVLTSQLLEALMIGVVASVGGLVAGLGMARLLKAMMAAVGFDVPSTQLTFLPRTAVAGMLVGLLVTLVSAVVPSIRAARTPPLGTANEIGIEAPRQRRRRLVIGGATTAIGMSLFVVGLLGGNLLLVGLGALVVFAGVFTLGPAIARPAARLLGAPVAAASGVTGAIARQNAARNPKRTSRTGGSLMIGVALVVSVSVITASVKDWVRDIYSDAFTGDYVVSTNSTTYGGLSPQLAVQLNQLPSVDAAAGVRVGAARDMSGDSIMYKAIDPATGGQLFDFHMVDGSIDQLSAEGALLDDDEATKRGVGVGDTIELTFLDDVTRSLTVEGIYSDEELAGPLVIANALHEQTGVDQLDVMVFIKLASGVSTTVAAAAIAQVAADYPNGTFQSRDEFIDDQAAQLDPLVNLMYALLFLAVLIALLSIANSMALSIHERSRELGLLRAVGMTRHQMRTSVAFESFIVSALGTTIGVLVGVFFGWSISVVIRGAGLGEFALPTTTIVIVALAAIVGGLLAAGKPAWHASRLDVLRSISTE